MLKKSDELYRGETPSQTEHGTLVAWKMPPMPEVKQGVVVRSVLITTIGADPRGAAGAAD
jgi:hypothetical protein